jgi:hypothetical protein
MAGATRSESLQMLAVIRSYAGLGIESFGSKPRWCFAISLPRLQSFARRFKSPAHSARAV